LSLLLQLPAPPAPPDPTSVFVTTGTLGPSHDLIIGVTMIILVIVGGLVLYPLVRALARRVEGKAGSGEDARLVEARVAELEHRLADVEERLDFSERMLSQREPVALPRDKAD